MLPTALRLAAALLVSVQFLPAQLALIRQGRESVGVPEAGDFHGGAVALGDFNGDGWDDLATGAPFEKTASPTFASGLVVINWGTPHGLTWENSTSLSVIDGGLDPAKNSQMGKALAFGDFNGDGIQDLAVGLPAAEIGGQSAAGAVYVYYGGPTVSGAAQLITQSQLGAANEGGDLFGSALATGRIGDDPYDDLVIGGPGENSAAGVVFIVRGGPQGLNTAQRQIISASDLGGTSRPGNRFGTSVAVGDVVGLPNQDLVIGEPFAEITPGAPASGRVWVAIGNDNGVSVNNVLEITPFAVGSFPFVQGNFGAALAIGNLWGDGGTLDLAIGAPGAHAGGRVHVGRGTLFGLTWPVTLTQNDNSLNGGVPGTDEANDNFGAAMAIGDHDDDGFDDLAVGCWGEDIELFGALGDEVGAVHIFKGSNAGPVQAGATTYYEFNLGDNLIGEGRLGYSLAAGRTSASRRHSFVAGAPYKHDSRGQVYDIAPWRQVLNPFCRSALAADCENNIIYALKPFEEVKIASTTKIMTLLLGCEATTRSPADPLHVALNETYTIEDWMYEAFPFTSGCSIFGFTPLPTQVLTENFTFEELLHMCFPPSGNDVCYAIADKMTNGIAEWTGHTSTAAAFVQLMNDRAAQIGMTHTHFTNPAGVDSGDPYSTAYDMWLLGVESMKNPLFREVANTTDFFVDKLMAVGEIGIYQSFSTNVSYGWLNSMKGRDSRIVGIKPGGTPGAKTTGVVAASPSAISNRHVHANGFRWYDSDYAKDKLAELAQLALSFCNTPVDGPGGLAGPIQPTHWNVNDGIGEAIQFGSFDSEPEPASPATGDGKSEGVDLTVYRPGPSGEGRFSLIWKYRALWELAPGASSGMTVGPAMKAEGYFKNITHEESPSSGTALLSVLSTATGPSPQIVGLAPGAQHVLPDWDAPTDAGSEWMVQVTNTGPNTIYLAFVGEFEIQPFFTKNAGDFHRSHLRPLGHSVRDGHMLYEGQPLRSEPVFQVELVLENRAEGDRFLPPLEISSFAITPGSSTTDTWSVRVESTLDPSPPLAAFYESLELETTSSLQPGDWDFRALIPVTDDTVYDWTGPLPRSDKLFLRAKGLAAD